MAITVTATGDAAAALEDAHPFLATRPVEHNLVHTLLVRRAADPQPGRYWIARDDDGVVAVAFLSPLGFHAALTPATDAVVHALVERVARELPELSGVSGDAPTTARFAGQWGAARHVPVTAHEAQRLYCLGALQPPVGVPGALRLARGDDLDLAVGWTIGFHVETDHAPETVRDTTRAATLPLIDAARLFLWDDDGPRSMAALSALAAGAVRVQGVYTPPAHRGRGYASAIVAAVSAHALTHGATTCLLYTQLSNPTSNAIYRAIGYEPVSEILHYTFG